MQPDWDENRTSWLTLTWFEGFGSRTFFKLHRRFHGDGARALNASRETYLECGVRHELVDRFLHWRSVTTHKTLIPILAKQHISFITHDDELYPPLLREIADPPYALFVRGTTHINAPNAAAVVGTRRNTPYGRIVAEQIGRDLANAGIPIVSGLAGGIDGITHEAALQQSGTCLAVLGTGVDDDAIYPRCNADLGKRIIKKDGSLISELPPGSESLKFHFPLRNRIIAGMCKLTIVVEAADKSGSLITAFQALEQNRDVFAVPGPITHAQSYGTNRLLAMGATPYTRSDEIIAMLRGKIAPRQAPLLPLSETDIRILTELRGPRHVDDLARALKIPVRTLNSHIAQLEIQGLIMQQQPQIIVKTLAAEHATD